MNIKKIQFAWCKLLVPLKPEKVFFIAIHHTASLTATPEQIHNWHLERDNGTWAGFGYNWYVRKDGSVYEGRGWNIGAQVRDCNSKSIGICFEGNYDIENNVSPAQMQAGIDLIKWLLPQLPNKIAVVKHKDLQTDTACPGKNFPFQNLIEKVYDTKPQIELSIAVLVEAGLIKSPEYWINNAAAGKVVNGAFIETLINNMANYIKTKG